MLLLEILFRCWDSYCLTRPRSPHLLISNQAPTWMMENKIRCYDVFSSVLFRATFTGCCGIICALCNGSSQQQCEGG